MTIESFNYHDEKPFSYKELVDQTLRDIAELNGRTAYEQFVINQEERGNRVVPLHTPIFKGLGRWVTEICRAS